MMAKRLDTKFVADEQNISKWFSQCSDFAFELHVVNELRRLFTTHGIGQESIVHHGGTYVDPVSGKHREFDIQTSRFCDDEDHVYQVMAAIECKNVKPHCPVVITRRQRDQREATIFGVSNTGHPAAFPNRFYKQNEMVGLSVDQIGLDAEGIYTSVTGLFDKWSQALGSLDMLVQSEYRQVQSRSDQKACLFFPVVVVPNDRLWVVDCRNDKTTKAEQVDRAAFFVSQKYFNADQQIVFNASHLEFLTVRGLNDLVDWFDQPSRVGRPTIANSFDLTT